MDLSMRSSQLTSSAAVSLAFCAFVDLYLAVYPGLVLFRLQMSLHKRIALIAALGLGSMCDFLYKSPVPSCAI